MFKLLILATVLAMVSANALDKYAGDVIPVKIFTAVSRIEYCITDKIELLDTESSCSSGSFPGVKYHQKRDGKVDAQTVIVVATVTEAEEALSKAKNCTNNGVAAEPVALIPLNDNFFIVYGKEPYSTSITGVLFAKTKPTPTELSDFVQSVDFLKNKVGNELCTTASKRQW